MRPLQAVESSFVAKSSPADILMIFPLEAAMQRAPIEEKTYPKLYAWMRRMQARACYKTAGEKASEASGEEYVPISDIKM